MSKRRCYLLLVLFLVPAMVNPWPAAATGITGGDFEGPPPGAGWNLILKAPAGGTDFPGLAQFANGTDHEGRVGDNPATAEAIGWEPSGLLQEFDCRLAGEPQPDRFCSVSFDAEHLGPAAGAGEDAKITLINATGTQTGEIPADGGTHTLSIEGCLQPTFVIFWVQSVAPDPAGLTSRLLVDDVDCACTEMDASTIEEDPETPPWDLENDEQAPLGDLTLTSIPVISPPAMGLLATALLLTGILAIRFRT